MTKTSKKEPAGKADHSKKNAPKSADDATSDNPADTEGGVRSPLDGKFEADHRPSR